MKRNRIISILIFFFATFISINIAFSATVNAKTLQSEKITLGAILPLTGAQAFLGQEIRNAMRLLRRSRQTGNGDIHLRERGRAIYCGKRSGRSVSTLWRENLFSGSYGCTAARRKEKAACRENCANSRFRICGLLSWRFFTSEEV